MSWPYFVNNDYVNRNIPAGDLEHHVGRLPDDYNSGLFDLLTTKMLYWRDILSIGKYQKEHHISVISNFLRWR